MGRPLQKTALGAMSARVQIKTEVMDTGIACDTVAGELAWGM